MVVSNQYSDIIKGATGSQFTLKQASEIQKQLDRTPTPTNGVSASWRNVRTGGTIIFTRNK